MINYIWGLLIIVIGIIVLIVLSRTKKHKKRERLSLMATSDDMHVDTVGGTVSTRMVLDPLGVDGYSAGGTTVVRKLLGNNGNTIILLHNSLFDQKIYYQLFIHTQSLLAL